MRRLAIIAVVLAIVAAACGDDGSAQDATTTTTAASEPGAAGDGAAGDADPPVNTALSDYEEAAAALSEPEFDRDLPPELPETPIGAYGYSRYVYTQAGGSVVPSLIEGPKGRQVRCQDPDKDCSYLELKALYESGDEVPGYLEMDRDTLGELVGQLDRVNAAISAYDDLDDACAAGLWRSTNQIANMGIHMIDGLGSSEFDPDRPAMVLFAKEGGVGIGSDEIGNCVNGQWTGEDGYVPVGAVFDLSLTADHPEGFAGPIDNWHIHYNTCISREEEAGQLGIDNAAVGEGGRAATTAAVCNEQGGQFLPVISSWMMHAYVADDFDAQAGVFSMFNPSVWPLSDPDTLLDQRTSQAGDDVASAQILNFSFGDLVVGVGETIRFANSDSVPHTVTAGSFIEPSDAFDSGVLGTGQAFDVSFDQAGQYELFCVLHPDMTGVVTVE